MKCPHCGVIIHESWKRIFDSNMIKLTTMDCPECEKIIIHLSGWHPSKSLGGFSFYIDKIVFPETTVRTVISRSVEEQFANDYREACAVLPISPRASATLSRRCLQNILENKLGVKKSDLSREIQECIDNKMLSPSVLRIIDEIRNLGNFAAHPVKSQNTSEIVDVEPGEAEACLDILEELFEEIFVSPARIRERQDRLNSKLFDAGKPSIKTL